MCAMYPLLLAGIPTLRSGVAWQTHAGIVAVAGRIMCDQAVCLVLVVYSLRWDCDTLPISIRETAGSFTTAPFL